MFRILPLFLVVVFFFSNGELIYKPGYRYQYHFISESQIFTVINEDSRNNHGIKLVCDIGLICLYQEENGDYAFEQRINNWEFYVVDENRNENKVEPMEELQKYISTPLIFTLSSLGAVSNVRASEEELEEVVTMKVGIAVAFQQHILEDDAKDVVVVDNQGEHISHVYRVTPLKQKLTNDKVDVYEAKFEESDFINFRDSTISKKDFGISSKERYEFLNGVLHSKTHFENISFDGNNAIKDTIGKFSNEEGILASIYSETTSTIKFQSVSVGNNLEFYNPERLKSFRSIQLSSSSNADSTSSSYQYDDDNFNKPPEVPDGMKKAYSFPSRFQLGTNSFGLTFGGYLSLGGTGICDEENYPGYFVHTRAAAKFNIFNKVKNIIDLGVENSFTEGSVLENNAHLRVFNVIKFDAPVTIGFKEVKSLFNQTYEVNLPFSMSVVGIGINFVLTVKATLDIPIRYITEDETLSIQVGLYPNVVLNVSVSAYASAIVAKVGVQLNGYLNETVVGVSKLNNKECSVGFYLGDHRESLSVKFEGFVQTISFFKIGLNTTIPFFNFSLKPADHVFLSRVYNFNNGTLSKENFLIKDSKDDDDLSKYLWDDE
jgi:hypothetical protein